jgi:hypothetical protein
MLRKFNRQRNRDARNPFSCDNRTRLTTENTGRRLGRTRRRPRALTGAISSAALDRPKPVRPLAADFQKHLSIAPSARTRLARLPGVG